MFNRQIASDLQDDRVLEAMDKTHPGLVDKTKMDKSSHNLLEMTVRAREGSPHQASQ